MTRKIRIPGERRTGVVQVTSRLPRRCPRTRKTFTHMTSAEMPKASRMEACIPEGKGKRAKKKMRSVRMCYMICICTRACVCVCVCVCVCEKEKEKERAIGKDRTKREKDRRHTNVLRLVNSVTTRRALTRDVGAVCTVERNDRLVMNVTEEGNVGKNEGSGFLRGTPAAYNGGAKNRFEGSFFRPEFPPSVTLTSARGRST